MLRRSAVGAVCWLSAALLQSTVLWLICGAGRRLGASLKGRRFKFSQIITGAVQAPGHHSKTAARTVNNCCQCCTTTYCYWHCTITSELNVGQLLYLQPLLHHETTQLLPFSTGVLVIRTSILAQDPFFSLPSFFPHRPCQRQCLTLALPGPSAVLNLDPIHLYQTSKALSVLSLSPLTQCLMWHGVHAKHLAHFGSKRTVPTASANY